MRVVMLGINYRTAALEVREKLALAGDGAERLIRLIRAEHPHAEAIVISTCNRTELYLARATHQSPSADGLRAMLASVSGVSVADVTSVSIHRENEAAVTHLMRVACGLDSMVLGEPQILGQIKRSYEHAQQVGSVGPTLHKVFQQAIAAAKQVRRQTGIDAGRVSVGSVAVDFARQVFERFDDKVVVGVGAGAMAKVTLRHMLTLAPARLWLVNRSLDRARALAADLCLDESRGGPRLLEALDELLVEADIVLTSTASSTPIITIDRCRPLLKRRRSRPLFILDLAVPRDVDPLVGSLNNVYLYNVDDLQEVIAQTHTERSGVVDRCEQLLREAGRACVAELQHRDVGQLIHALRTRLHEIGLAERDRTMRKLNGAAPDELPELIEEHTHRVINKILHLPLSVMDHRNPEAPLGFYAAALRALFDLKQCDEGKREEASDAEQSDDLRRG